MSARLAGFRKQFSAAMVHGKTLFCHQPKVALKEQFPGAPGWLLTQAIGYKASCGCRKYGGSWTEQPQTWQRESPLVGTAEMPESRAGPFLWGSFGALVFRLGAVSTGVGLCNNSPWVRLSLESCASVSVVSLDLCSCTSRQTGLTPVFRLRKPKLGEIKVPCVGPPG